MVIFISWFLVICLFFLPTSREIIRYSNKKSLSWLRKLTVKYLISTVKGKLFNDVSSPCLGYIFHRMPWKDLKALYIKEGYQSFITFYSESFMTLSSEAIRYNKGYIKDLDSDEDRFISDILNN